MEVCSPCNTADHIGSCKSARTLQDPSSQSHHNSGALSMNDLKACLTGLQKDEGLTSASGANPSSGENGTREFIHFDETELQAHYYSEKHLSKSATFPQSSGCKAHSENENVENGGLSGTCVVDGSWKQSDQLCSRSLSLPASFKPIVSAMKGSRERQGLPPKKLTVTWAPDVYDPIPTSVSHVPSSKPQRYRGTGKRSGRNKQKSSAKSARNGGKGKEKKCKNSSRSYVANPFHEESGVAVSGKELMLEAQMCAAEMVF